MKVLQALEVILSKQGYILKNIYVDILKYLN
jgi:hypothetical protein